MSCTNLTPTEINYLARILQLLPDADPNAYATRVTTLLSSPLLPPRLKRPSRLSTLLRRSTTLNTPPLCILHKRLNAYTVRSLFKRLALEAGRNLNSLVFNHRLLGTRQRELVGRLRDLHALWFSVDAFKNLFLRRPLVGDRWRFQQNGCEACVLAHVGGNHDALLDLRAALLSRTKTPNSHRHGSQPPTLLKFVDAWLNGLGIKERVLKKNGQEAQALVEVRKRIWKERARDRYRCSGAPEPELEPQSSRVIDVRDLPDLDAAAAARGGGDTACGSDIEMDIIEHYAALTSTLHFSSKVAGLETTVVDGGISGTTRVSSGLLNRPAEEQAGSYQDLLTTPPLQDRSEWDLDSVSQEERSHTGGTWCSVICESDPTRAASLRKRLT